MTLRQLKTFKMADSSECNIFDISNVKEQNHCPESNHDSDFDAFDEELDSN